MCDTVYAFHEGPTIKGQLCGDFVDAAHYDTAAITGEPHELGLQVSLTDLQHFAQGVIEIKQKCTSGLACHTLQSNNFRMLLAVLNKHEHN